MASRNPDELVDELRDLDVESDEESIDIYREECRETIEAQLELLSEFDSKASKLIRLNFVFLGVLVSVASIVSQNGSGNSVGDTISAYINEYMILGVTALVLSTVAAAITFTISELDVGLSGRNVQALLEAPISSKLAKQDIVLSHIKRINHNRSENTRNVPFIQASILLVIAAMVLFALGLYQIANGGVPCVVLSLVVILYGVFVWGVGFPEQVLEAYRDYKEWR